MEFSKQPPVFANYIIAMKKSRTRTMTDQNNKSQRSKFEEAARALECDDEPERFKERLAKLGEA